VAREVHSFDVTVPAGTPKATPLVTELAIPPREVTEIEIIIPPGPRGEVGFQIAAAGRQMLPYEPGAFFVTDNETIRWPISEQITSGAWELIAYNTGSFNHTLEIRLLADLPGVAATPELLPLAALQSPSTVSLPPAPALAPLDLGLVAPPLPELP